MPASETIFEIHACAKGHWRTLGTFEDANDAIAEAVRLRRTLKYSGIRVTAESYQNSSGKFASRVVYRYSHKTRPPVAPAGWRTAASGPTDGFTRASPSEPESADPLVDQEFMRMIAVRLGFVILAAIVTLWALHAG
jgi:hypothetical protein